MLETWAGAEGHKQLQRRVELGDLVHSVRLADKRGPWRDVARAGDDTNFARLSLKTF